MLLLINNVLFADVPECDYTRDCYYPRARLSSVNYPNHYFLKGSSCTWRIVTGVGTHITFRVLDFDIPAYDECLTSHLSVYDGVDDHDVLIGRYCNYLTPPTRMHTGFNMAFLKLITAAGNPGKGFLIEYSSTDYQHSNDSFDSSGKFC